MVEVEGVGKRGLVAVASFSPLEKWRNHRLILISFGKQFKMVRGGLC